ncbi:MAG: hypothetical protein ABI199_05630 [Bacteroidia bacterium]
MNTKYVMISSVCFMGLLGLAASFFPKEILESAGQTPTELLTLLLQITGALYLGFALINWMAKKILIGGIYSKPLCMGNFLHFMVAALALVKATMDNPTSKYILIATVAYSTFAVLFGFILFTNPREVA